MTRPTKKRSKRGGRRKAKVTSKRVSEAAGRLMSQLRQEKGGKFYFHHRESRSGIAVAFDMTRDVKAVAGSALVQKPRRAGRAG